MPSNRVYLHIGAPKTGSTYVQGVLAANAQALRERGVYFPVPWVRQVRAAWDLGQPSARKPPEVDGAWDRLVQDLQEWDGETAIVSMEWMVGLHHKGIQRILSALSPSEVHMVLTGRDLGRVLPASWQEFMRNGERASWREFLASAKSERPPPGSPGQQFWARQDLPRFLERWARLLPAERLHLVTVPPPGSDPQLLWRRFADLTGLGPDFSEAEGTSSNESVGAVSAELLRLVNSAGPTKKMPRPTYQRFVKKTLAGQVLSGRAHDEPRVRLPEDHSWIQAEADRMIKELSEVEMDLVGDLEDLRPRLDYYADSEQDGSPATSEDLLAAAVDGLAGLATEAARQVNALEKERNSLRQQVKDLQEEPDE